MIKNTFIYAVIIVFVGVTAWFFVQKAQNTTNVSNISKITAPTPTPQGQNQALEKKDDWVTLESGLQMWDVVVGTGKNAEGGDMIAAHYIGTFANGNKFDSSYDRGEPFAFILGGGMVIKGWDQGLLGMKVGGKRKLIIPPELAYGNRDIGNGKIPPNSTLFFEIELVAAQNPKGGR